MKKMLGVVVSLGMLFLMTINVFAVEPKLNFDLLQGGTAMETIKTNGLISGAPDPSVNSNTQVNNVLGGYVLGIEYPLNSFKIGAELGKGNVKDNSSGSSADLSLTNLKAGYRLVTQDKFKLDGTLSLLNISTQLSGGGESFSGNMLGVDGVYNITPKAILEGSVGYSLLGASMKNGIYALDHPSLWEYKIKLNLFIAKKVNATIGYQSYRYSGRLSIYNDPSNYINLNTNTSFTGLTFGLIYKF